MKRIYFILITTVAIAFASCSDRDMDAVKPDTGQGAPIIDVPEGATQGKILVKFKPEAASFLDAAATRSIGGALTRSGISDMDVVLQRIGASKLERIFPVDNRTEERTRKAGLNLWYVIHFAEDMDLEQLARDLSQVADVAKVQFTHAIRRSYDPNARATVLTKQAMARMLRTTRTTDASASDPYFNLQWGCKNDGSILPTGEKNDKGDDIVPAVAGVDVNCGEAWKLCTGDPSIIVAVLDEGVMYDHPDLVENMWVNEDETFASKEDADGNGYAGDRYGYNFTDDKGYISYDDPNDTGHGTHMAGIISAVRNNGEGISGIAGGDKASNQSGVKIMSCQVFSGSKGCDLYQEAKAVKYAADNGAVILQCSWGYNSGLANPVSGYSPGFVSDKDWVDAAPLEKEAFDYFLHNAGSPNDVIDGGIIVFAAGNEYAAMAGYPGAYPDYISVAALAADGTPSSYSNYAAGVSIVAPGGDSDYHQSLKGKIYSTLPPSANEDGEEDVYYGYMEGTSQACPHVSGVAALGLSYAAKLHRHFRADEFRKMILESTHPVEPYFKETKVYWHMNASFGQIAAGQMEPAAYADNMGAGLIDAYELLKAVEGGGVEMTVPNMYVAVGATSKINYSRYFKNGESMTFTCVVDDNSIAAFMTENNITFTLKGLKVGSTKATVKASDGTKQDFFITVRKNDSWM